MLIFSILDGILDGAKRIKLFLPKKLEKQGFLQVKPPVFGGDKRDRTADLLNAMAPHAKIEWIHVHKIDAKDTKY